MARKGTKLKRRLRRRTRRKQRGGSQELSYTHPGAKIKVFMSADRMEPTLVELISSLKRHKYSYEVLGFGKKWSGFITKMENYLDGIERYMKVAGPDAIAIFIDAFDVLCIKSADKQLEAYMAKKRPMPIVIGVEIVCFYKSNCSLDALDWYDVHNIYGGRKEIEKTFMRPNPNMLYYETPKNVFLNSGFIMGPVKELYAMFKGMMDSGINDDQLAAIDYMKKNPSKVDYDLEEALIRNKLKPREYLPDENGETGPGFVHFPGTRAPNEIQDKITKYYRQYPQNLK